MTVNIDNRTCLCAALLNFYIIYLPDIFYKTFQIKKTNAQLFRFCGVLINEIIFFPLRYNATGYSSTIGSKTLLAPFGVILTISSNFTDIADSF